ncbi:hypothetical protein GCM10010353_70870 [Streptomyces chryseus]|nr:hypothetical protein GCM10010353_70870 [Streptomyces chryseus]
MTDRQIALCSGLLAALVVSGCSAAPTGSLNTQTLEPSPSCRVHQTEEPGDQYMAGSGADTHSILRMMRYYTTNGRKPFCDGQGASAVDRRWRDLYIKLGGNRTHAPRSRRKSP